MNRSPSTVSRELKR
nr:hypothetical protein [Mycoplasmopsis bovis]